MAGGTPTARCPGRNRGAIHRRAALVRRCSAKASTPSTSSFSNSASCSSILEASLDQKQRLQTVFFPEGLRFDGLEFGTAVTCLAFKQLGPGETEKTGMASPRGLDVMYQYPKKTLRVPLVA